MLRPKSSKKFLHTVKKWEKKYQKKIALLEVKLASTRDKATNLETRQKKEKESDKLQKKAKSAETTLNEEKGKWQEAKKSTQELKDKLSTVETRKLNIASRALAKFRKLREYKDELTKGSVDAY